MQTNVNGVNLFYESAGEGSPAIVFVHGLGGTSNVWHAARTTLSRFHRVVTYDLSGSGRSDRSPREYSIEGWVEDLSGLLDELNIPAAVIVGHSMGTVIVQQFAARYPQKTTALVLAGALTELGPPGKEAFTSRAEAVEKEGMIAIADTVLGGALSPGTRERNLALSGLVREVLLSNDPACYAGHCRALMKGSARSAQEKITAPTLLVVGDQDPVTPLSLQKQVASAIKNTQIRVIPNTAHMTMLETPEAFLVAVLEFLAGLP
jgi:3-oxoadipate enol-lactonase